MNQRESQPITVVQYANQEATDTVSPSGSSLQTGSSLTKPDGKASFASGPQSLLSRVLGWSLGARGEAGKPSPLEQFLASEDVQKQLELWFGARTLERDESLTTQAIIQQLQRDIAKIDACVSRQLNAVLHNTAFQKLEASWRGLAHLTECADRWNAAPIILNVLNVTWSELRSDFENASEFDQSSFFKKVYEEGIGQAGAYPFSSILLDFAIHPRPSRSHAFDDIEILNRIAEVGQAAFCPVISNADASMFDEDRYSELRPPGSPRDVDRKEQDHYERLHNDLTFFRWKRFRSDESARFVSLTLPRMLMRKPYRAGGSRYFGFAFDEEIRRADDYLWGGAAWGMGEVVLRAFAEGSWLADIRGAQRGIESGGVVLGPTYDAFSTEPRDTAAKPVTEMVIGDDFERSLSKLGFMPLCACKDMPLAAFYSSVTTQKPVIYNDARATASAKVSSMLNYMLCASRFAHYIKALTRDMIGSCSGPEQLEYMLQNWLAGYICDAEADSRIRAEKPLRDGEIKVMTVPGSPGEYRSVLHIAPHFGFEEVSALIVLKDEKLVKRGN